MLSFLLATCLQPPTLPQTSHLHNIVPYSLTRLIKVPVSPVCDIYSRQLATYSSIKTLASEDVDVDPLTKHILYDWCDAQEFVCEHENS